MKGKQILAMALCLILTMGTLGFDSNAGSIAGDLYRSGQSVSDNSVSDNQSPGDIGNGSVSGNTVSGNEKPGGGNDTVSGNEPGDGNGTVSGNEPGDGDGTVSGNEPGDGDGTVSGNEPGDGDGTVSGNEPGDGDDTEDKDTIIEAGGVKYTVNKDGVLISCENAQGNISIPEGIVAIGEGVFRNNSEITSVIYPESLERIEAGAFENCSALFMFYTRDRDHSKLSVIGDSAFQSCTSLKYFTDAQTFAFSDSVTNLGNYAFSGCTSLKTVTLPKKLAIMGTGVFKNCTSLTDIEFSPNYSVVPAESFSGCLHLTSITWKNISRIETDAFRGCASELYYLELPATIASVKKGAFEECARLNSVVIYNDNIELEVDSFTEKYSFTMYANEGSNAHYYATGYDNIQFVDLKGKNIGTKKYNINQDNLSAQSVSAYVYTQTVEDGVEKNVETKTATTGTKLYVQLTIPANRQLVSGTLKANGKLLTLEKDNVYSFVQGVGDTWLTAEFESTYYTEPLIGLRAETADDISDGMKVGQTTQLFVFSSNPEVESPLKLSRFNLKSNNSKVVKISNSGLITAVGKGSASILIYPKDKDGKDGTPVTKLEITVKESKIANIELYLTDYDEKKVTVEEIAEGKQLVLTERAVFSSNVKIQLRVNGYDEEGSRLESAYKWSTSDSKIVKLDKTSTAVGNASNTLTVQKGASGEATVTIEAQDGSKLKRYLRVCVYDGTPNLIVESSEYNSYRTEPFVFYLLEAYGDEVDSDKVKFEELAIDAEGSAQSGSAKFKLTQTGNGRYVVSARSEGQIIPEGQYKFKVSGRTKGLTFFSHELVFTVKNSLPSAKVKQTGKINLFYTNAGADQAVKTTISGIGKNVIDSYSLESLKGTDAQQQEDYNRFVENFQIDENGIITRKADQIGKYEYGKNKGKVVAKGYLVLHFKGYRPEAVKKIAITVPTSTTKPGLILSQTNATYNSKKQSGAVNEARVQLLDKKTKKPVSLQAEGYTVDWNATKTANCFFAGGNPSIEEDEIVIPCRLPDKTSKAVLIIGNPEKWGENTLELTFTAKVTSAMPKASLSQSKVTLNTLYSDQTARFTLKANQTDARLSQEQTFVPAVMGNSEQMKLLVTYQDGVGTVSIPNNQKVEDGTYKFVCVVKSDDLYDRNGALTDELNKVTLSVIIKNSKPAIKLKSSSFSLNRTVKGKEEVQRAYTLNYTPSADSGYQIDNTQTQVTCTTNPQAADMVNFRFEGGALYASLKDNFSLANGKYKFEIVPVFTNSGSGSDADIREINGSVLKLTLTVHDKKVGVKLTAAKGKVDLLNRSATGITYKVSISNVNDAIAEVKLKDVENNTWQDGESTRFYAEIKGNQIIIKAKEDAELTAGKAYTVKLYYELKVSNSDDNFWDLGNGYLMEKNITIKPVQTFPKLTVTNEDPNRYLSNRAYTAQITVTPKKGSTARISDIAWAADVKNEVKQMFAIENISEPNPETGAVTFTVKLKDDVFCKVNSTQTLKLAAVYEGQSANKQGQAFSVKIKVNR